MARRKDHDKRKKRGSPNSGTREKISESVKKYKEKQREALEIKKRKVSAEGFSKLFGLDKAPKDICEKDDRVLRSSGGDDDSKNSTSKHTGKKNEKEDHDIRMSRDIMWNSQVEPSDFDFDPTFDTDKEDALSDDEQTTSIEGGVMHNYLKAITKRLMDEASMHRKGVFSSWLFDHLKSHNWRIHNYSAKVICRKLGV